MNWLNGLKAKVKTEEPLKDKTTFKIGGAAKYFAEPKDINDLKLLLRWAKRYKLTFWIIGAGSNILIGDKGIDGLVVRLASPFFKRISFEHGHLRVGSGLSLSQLLVRAKNEGLSGLEFLAGIPGTVGGALAMNAGAHNKSILDLLEKVTVMDYNGKIRILNKKEIKFGYRSCGLSRYVILNAQLKLKKDDKEEIKRRIAEYLCCRKRTQDLSKPSAGCIFKNPKARPAGMLIDLCGLKGNRVGSACISQKHANFILNDKNATAKDVLRLMDLIKKRVRNRFNITLEPEIKIWQ